MSARLDRLAAVAGAGGFLVLLCSLFVARPVLALSRSDAMCRSHLFAATGKLARDTIVELNKCHAQRMAGRLPASTECNSAATAPNRLLLLRDEGNLRTRVRKRCAQPADVSPPAALGFTTCPAPCAAIAVSSYADVAECLICRTRAETSRLVADVFGSPPTAAGNERICQRRIGRATKVYVAAQLNLQRRCHLAQDLGRLNSAVDCRTYDPDGKLVRARQRLDEAIAACGDETLNKLDSCGPTVAEEQQCMHATAETAAAGLYAGVFSPAPSTIIVGSATGVRTETVTVPVSLSGGAGIVTALTVDLEYDPTQAQVIELNGNVDCTLSPAIGAGTAFNKILSAAVLPPVGAHERLRLTVFGLGVATGIPDGELFRCNFTIQPSAGLGTITLGSMSIAFDAASNELASVALDGSIEVQSNGNPEINLGDAQGKPGEAVVIGATLAQGEGRVASLSAAITYDPAQVRVGGGAVPSCNLDPAIGPGSAADKILEAAVSPSGGLETLVVTVWNPGNSNLIPDGALFTCDFEIDAAATDGVKLLNNQPAAVDGSGSSVAVDGRDGEIDVVVPHFAIGSATGVVGETVAIPVSLIGGEHLMVEALIDITYDTSQVRVINSGGIPECDLAPSIGAGTPAEKTLTATILPGTGGGETLSLLLTSPANSNPLPDGLLVVCNFAIDDAAAIGNNTLDVAVAARDGAGVPLIVTAADGSISVVTLPAPRMDLDHVVGSPGDMVTISASFLSGNESIAALSMDVRYDATLVRVRRVSGVPDCTIDPAIGPGSVPNKSLLLAVSDVGGGFQRLRVGMISFSNSNLIPDGPVFSCRFDIDPAAPDGAVTLLNTSTASDPSGDEVLIHEGNGSITVF